MANLDSMTRTLIACIGNATNTVRAARKDNSTFSDAVAEQTAEYVNALAFRWHEIAAELVDDDDVKFRTVHAARERFNRAYNGEEPDPRETRHETKPVVTESVEEIAAAAAAAARRNAASRAAQRAAELEAMLNAGYEH